MRADSPLIDSPTFSSCHSYTSALLWTLCKLELYTAITRHYKQRQEVATENSSWKKLALTSHSLWGRRWPSYSKLQQTTQKGGSVRYNVFHLYIYIILDATSIAYIYIHTQLQQRLKCTLKTNSVINIAAWQRRNRRLAPHGQHSRASHDHYSQ